MIHTSVRSSEERAGLMPLGTVLVVEDRLISNLVRAVLQKRGYQVTLAEAAEAMDLMRSPDSDVQVLVTNAPGTFLDFADRVPLVYLSSLPDPLMETAFRSCRVLVKPFIPQDLAEAVSQLMPTQ